jgi:transposase
MVTDRQYRRLMTLSKTEASLASAAAKAGMDEKTARKYVRLGAPPSQLKGPRSYRTRPDPFVEVWPEVQALLERDPSLQALTIFDHLTRVWPGQFQASQLRTLQRRIKAWRGVSGAPREVFFPQEHTPGRQAQSDFTYMQELKVTLAGQPFDHMFYHFTLTYSNWEWGMICFSESFEALADGLQNALWQLGGVPREHRTDSLTAAVTILGDRDVFTQRYQGLLDHYGLSASHTNTGRGNENGDVEQSHYRFKTAVDQELRLRSSRDFASRDEYEAFLRRMLERRNQVRRDRVGQDVAALRALPDRRLEAYTRETVKVTRNSTVLVRSNFYSVPSQLIGERVEVRLYGEHIEVWYAAQMIDRCSRLRGKGKHRIEYRHIIDTLVRKPGAFANYRYQQSLFPRLVFRVAYDWLREHAGSRADAQYVRLLEMAAKQGEDAVAVALTQLLAEGAAVGVDVVRERVREHALEQAPDVPRVQISPVALDAYDTLLMVVEEVVVEEEVSEWLQ